MFFRCRSCCRFRSRFPFGVVYFFLSVLVPLFCSASYVVAFVSTLAFVLASVFVSVLVVITPTLQQQSDIPDVGHQNPALPSADEQDEITFEVHVDSSLPDQASGGREENLAQKFSRTGKWKDTPKDSDVEDVGGNTSGKTQPEEGMEDIDGNDSEIVHEGSGENDAVEGIGDWVVEEGVDSWKVQRDVEDESNVDVEGAKRARKGFLRRSSAGALERLAKRPQGRGEAGGGGGLKGNDDMLMGDPVEFAGAEDPGEDLFGGLLRGGEEKKEREGDGEEEGDKQDGDEERGDNGEEDDEEPENSKEEDDYLLPQEIEKVEGADALAEGNSKDRLAKPFFELKDPDVDEEGQKPPPTVASFVGVHSKDHSEGENGDRSKAVRNPEAPPAARNGNLRGSAVDVEGAVPEDEAALGKAELPSAVDGGVKDQDKEDKGEDREERRAEMGTGKYKRDDQSDGGLGRGAGNDEPGALEAGVEPGRVQGVGEDKEGARGGVSVGAKNEERLRAAADPSLDEEATSLGAQGVSGDQTGDNVAGRDNAGGSSNNRRSEPENRGEVIDMGASTDEEALEKKKAAAVAAQGLLLPKVELPTEENEPVGREVAEEELEQAEAGGRRGSDSGDGLGAAERLEMELEKASGPDDDLEEENEDEDDDPASSGGNGYGGGSGGGGSGRVGGRGDGGSDDRKGQSRTPAHRSDDDAEVASGADGDDDGFAHSTIGGRPREQEQRSASRFEKESSLSSSSSSSSSSPATRRDDDDTAYEASGGDSEDYDEFSEGSSEKASSTERRRRPPAPRHEIPDSVLLKRDEDARKFMARSS